MTLSILLIIYFIVLAVFTIFVFFDIYHLVRFGEKKSESWIMLAIFIGVILLILGITWQRLIGVDWSQPLFDFNAFDPFPS